MSLLSTSEFLLWSYSNKTFRTKAFFIGITFGGSIWTREILFHRLFCYSLYWCSRTALVVVFLYGGSIPFVVSLCFASQRTPTVCAYCAGSISTIGLRSFLLKVSGVSSHLSFCCTSLVSGFIIHARARFVHSQNAQWIRYIFSINDKKNCIVHTNARLKQPPCAVWTARRAFCGKPLRKNCQTSSVLSSAAVDRTPSEPMSYIINR